MSTFGHSACSFADKMFFIKKNIHVCPIPQIADPGIAVILKAEIEALQCVNSTTRRKYQPDFRFCSTEIGGEDDIIFCILRKKHH